MKRFGAAIVDGVIFWPLYLIDPWIYQNVSNTTILFVWITFVGCGPVFYSIILHYKYGYTIGKWVASVKVLDVSESKALTFRQSVLRDSFYLLVVIFGFIYYAVLMMYTGSPETILSDYSVFSNNPIFWWTLIELITMLTNSKRRALHDFMAKTVVIRMETGG